MYNKQKTLTVDREHIWHPYTAMKDYADRDPLVMVRGKGVKLYDADNTMYYDTVSSWWCNVHGHGHPAIQRGVRKQLEQLEHVLFAGITHPAAAELVDRLQPFLPKSLSRFFFSDNGSTSVEIALKMAFQYWQNQGVVGRTQFVFLENSYHGDTAGSMSVGGIGLYHQLYAPMRFKSFQAASPNCSACPHRQTPMTWDALEPGCGLECFQSMETLVREHHEQIAAVIVEPRMQGAAGIFVYPPEYLRRLRALATQWNVLLIFDEVATGFGRTGTFFAHEQAQAVPDFLCLSKGLTSGTLPLALTVTSESVYQAFYDDALSNKTFFHGHTYTANPLACAAGVANLKLFKKLQLPQSQTSVIAYFHEQLRQFEAFDWVGDIRYLGFIGAIDVVRSRRTRETFSEADRIGFQIYLESLKHQIFLRPLGDTIYWYLPLCVTRKDIAAIMQRSRTAIQRAVETKISGAT